jgi:hypothetical protein
MQDFRTKGAKAAEVHLAGRQRVQMAVATDVVPGEGVTILKLWQKDLVYILPMLDI